MAETVNYWLERLTRSTPLNVYERLLYERWKESQP